MLWNALILGFFGSTHCVLMCGPLVMAVPGQKSFSRFIISRLSYNLARIITYTCLGIIAGFIGQSFSLAIFQQTFSILSGIFICLLSFAIIAQKIEGNIARAVLKISTPVKKILSRNFEKSSLGATFVSGLLNGILPCGLVYIALSTAMGTFSAQEGGLFMLIFGLGTFPAMLLMSLIGKISISPVFYRISSVYIFLLGVLLILRGANLDIPFLSPVLGYLYPELGDSVICD